MYEIKIKEYNRLGNIVRNKTLMRTSYKQQALRFFRQKVDSLNFLDKGNNELILMNGDEVLRKYDF